MPEPETGKEPDRGSSAQWQSLVATLSRIPRVGLISIVGPFVLLVAGYCLWITYGAKHLDQAKYGLRQDSFVLTAQPDWIKSNVLEEIFLGSNLGRLNTLDHQTSATVANAFRIHPWIRQVFKVQKYSGNVQVLVEYREPLAMVYDESSANARPSISPSPSDRSVPPSALTSSTPPSTLNRRPSINFFPVDVDSVLLPTQDFSSDQIPTYFLIYAKGAVPLGKKFGEEYGDARIKEALMLCRLLRDDRVTLGLEKIYSYPEVNGGTGPHCTLEITTKTGKHIRWGHAPGLETAGEPGAQAKYRKLREILTNPNSPDASTPEIDLVEKAKARLSNLFKSDLNR